MMIAGKVHCLFEQSGVFKKEFLKLNIMAEDYDIQDNFGETNHKIDLFKEIENAYEGEVSLFDDIVIDDLILAFFPCIYFCATSQIAFYWSNKNYRSKSIKEKTDLILQRSKNREYYFSVACKMMAVAQMRGLRLIMENPWGLQTYLKANFIMKPTFIDFNRRKRGDSYVKPTAYWFINCEPTHGETFLHAKEHKTIRSSSCAPHSGICSEERSMISTDYARNFICDFILGKAQRHTQLDLFER